MLPLDENFISTTALSDRSLEESYDVDLALRFIIIAEMESDKLKGIGDVGNFLTEKMNELAASKKYNKAKAGKLFKKTFSVLNESLGENSFKRYSGRKKRHEGGFLLSLFEP